MSKESNPPPSKEKKLEICLELTQIILNSSNINSLVAGHSSTFEEQARNIMKIYGICYEHLEQLTSK